MYSLRVLQRAVVLGSLVMLMSGCGYYHDYPPFNLVGVKKPRPGFSDLQLDERTFRVEYRFGEQLSEKVDLLKTLLLQRGAELVQGRGCRYFTVVYGRSYATSVEGTTIQEVSPGFYWMEHRARAVVPDSAPDSWRTAIRIIYELHTVVRGVETQANGVNGMIYDIADYVPYAR